MKHCQLLLLVFMTLVIMGSNLTMAKGRDTIIVVGSSTVFPFTTVVAERFGKLTEYRTPIIESTGTGGGMKLFCAGEGTNTPDISNASRRIKKSEFEMCRRNHVQNITEVLIGYDGIVMANSKQGSEWNFSRQELFLALAKKVPASDDSDRLVDNFYHTWRDINPNLPAIKIQVFGPPPTSGTRDAFTELVMEDGCQQFDWLKYEQTVAPLRYREICHSVREDGYFIEVGENDNIIVKKLIQNPQAFGIIGFSFLDRNLDRLQGAKIDGVTPSFTSIAHGSYAISRPLYFYVKNAHEGKIPGIKEFLVEFTSEAAMGNDGYLIDKGLIPLSTTQLQTIRDNVQSLKALSLY